MPVSYTTPGVYIEEIPRLPIAVVAVETAVPAFIGYTVKARKTKANDLLFVPTAITSLVEYEKYFGAPANEKISVVINDTINKTGNTTTSADRKINVIHAFLKNYMHYQLQLFFANGGGRCYIVSTGKANGIYKLADYKQGLDKLRNYDDPTLLLFPDAINLINPTELYELYNHALEQAYELQDRFVVMDVKHEGPEQSAIDLFRSHITGGTQPKSLKYGAAYYPLLKTNLGYHYDDRSAKIIHSVITREQGKADKRLGGEFNKLKLNDVKLEGTTVYTQIKNEINQIKLTLASSASVAGVYAKTDRERGVWKAPANINLAMIESPIINLNEQQQAGLNVDAVAGKSINAIRAFVGKGTLVWGARTLAGNDNEWRYIPVRRFFNMVEESLKKSTYPFVFEPNDANTWMKIRAMVENFLMLQWRQGALQGAKPEQAFFVKVGLGQTMTAQDILDGRLIIEIGMALVRPAEFSIIRISHMMQP